MAERRIPDAIARVRERVSRAAERGGRNAREVTIVAVTKGVNVGDIAQAAESGINDFGENRAKELRDKADALGGDLRWHFVGAVQTNKLRYLDRACMIHSLDRRREAEALQDRAERMDRVWDVLVEVNVGREPQKQGVSLEHTREIVESLGKYSRVRPRGLMFVAPQVENAEDVRTMFTQMRELREGLAGLGLSELSMGMSDDFEVAVEEGSTIVRVGRAIFGATHGRPPREGL